MQQRQAAAATNANLVIVQNKWCVCVSVSVYAAITFGKSYKTAKTKLVKKNPDFFSNPL